MIAWASGLGMGTGRFSTPLKGVGGVGMPDMGQVTTRCVESVYEVPPGPAVLRLLVPGVAVGI